jgi:hypothetical protein
MLQHSKPARWQARRSRRGRLVRNMQKGTRQLPQQHQTAATVQLLIQVSELIRSDPAADTGTRSSSDSVRVRLQLGAGNVP